MAVDTEAKRWGMLQWASGPSYYPHVFNPDTSGLQAIERATVLKLYGGIAWATPAASASRIDWTLDDIRADWTLNDVRQEWTI